MWRIQNYLRIMVSVVAVFLVAGLSAQTIDDANSLYNEGGQALQEDNKELAVQNEKIKLQIWDLAGQERFTEVRAGYYMGAHGALLVFDITRPESFSNLLNWCEELRKNAKVNAPIPAVIIANKTDLRDKKNSSHISTAVAKKQLDNFTKKLENGEMKVGYVETSAKTGENVDEAFRILGTEILKFRKII